MKRHFVTTIWFALACGLLFAPAFKAVGLFVGGRLAFSLVLWAYLAAYAVVLQRWSRARLTACLFPLVLLLGLILAGLPQFTFFTAALLVLAWLRTGVCFPQGGMRAAAVELGLAGAGVMLVELAAPRTTLAWAAAVWLFFLVQSLYFVTAMKTGEDGELEAAPNPFDRAQTRAERILAEDAWRED